MITKKTIVRSSATLLSMVALLPNIAMAKEITTEQARTAIAAQNVVTSNQVITRGDKNNIDSSKVQSIFTINTEKTIQFNGVNQIKPGDTVALDDSGKNVDYAWQSGTAVIQALRPATKTLSYTMSYIDGLTPKKTEITANAEKLGFDVAFNDTQKTITFVSKDGSQVNQLNALAISAARKGTSTISFEPVVSVPSSTGNEQPIGSTEETSTPESPAETIEPVTIKATASAQGTFDSIIVKSPSGKETELKLENGQSVYTPTEKGIHEVKYAYNASVSKEDFVITLNSTSSTGVVTSPNKILSLKKTTTISTNEATFKEVSIVLPDVLFTAKNTGKINGDIRGAFQIMSANTTGKQVYTDEKLATIESKITEKPVETAASTTTSSSTNNTPTSSAPVTKETETKASTTTPTKASTPASTDAKKNQGQVTTLPATGELIRKNLPLVGLIVLLVAAGLGVYYNRKKD